MQSNEFEMAWFSSPNRYLCLVLDEMREAVKCLEGTQTARHLSGLIEEAQTYGNRMEAALSDWSDVRSGTNKKKQLKEEIRKLQAERDALEPEDKEED